MISRKDAYFLMFAVNASAIAMAGEETINPELGVETLQSKMKMAEKKLSGGREK